MTKIQCALLVIQFLACFIGFSNCSEDDHAEFYVSCYLYQRKYICYTQLYFGDWDSGWQAARTFVDLNSDKNYLPVYFGSCPDEDDTDSQGFYGEPANCSSRFQVLDYYQDLGYPLAESGQTVSLPVASDFVYYYLGYGDELEFKFTFAYSNSHNYTFQRNEDGSDSIVFEEGDPNSFFSTQYTKGILGVGFPDLNDEGNIFNTLKQQIRENTIGFHTNVLLVGRSTEDLFFEGSEKVEGLDTDGYMTPLIGKEFRIEMQNMTLTLGNRSFSIANSLYARVDYMEPHLLVPRKTFAKIQIALEKNKECHRSGDRFTCKNSSTPFQLLFNLANVTEQMSFREDKLKWDFYYGGKYGYLREGTEVNIHLNPNENEEDWIMGKHFVDQMNFYISYDKMTAGFPKELYDQVYTGSSTLIEDIIVPVHERTAIYESSSTSFVYPLVGVLVALVIVAIVIVVLCRQGKTLKRWCHTSWKQGFNKPEKKESAQDQPQNYDEVIQESIASKDEDICSTQKNHANKENGVTDQEVCQI